REDINYTPSDIAKDDTFNRMFSSYTIKPRLAIGFLGNRLSPFFRNVKRVSIHEDYDYSTSLERINPSYGFGALVYFSWKNLSIGNESTWNNLKIQRSIVHSSGQYQSQLKEISRFFNSKICMLYDFSMPFGISRKNKIPAKLSVGPSLTFMKLRSSDGTITSSLPVYSFTSGNSSPAISSNETNTARVDLAGTRNKSNWLMGLEAKLWFFMFKKYWMYSWSYQVALRDYTSEQLSLGNEVLFNSYYVDSPTRLRCFQMALAYYIPMRPHVTSYVHYE
ncbi:MAG: hypothetical protein ACKOW8_09945, partial [Flavobacteriales bacterium]